MVKLLSPDDNAELHETLLAAEKLTSAEFAVVIARASDEYRAVALACGIVLGGLVALVLWYIKIVTDFPLLLIAQFVVCALVLILPPLRHLCLKFAPRRLLLHRASQRAAAEYLHLTHRLPASIPIVLLYVSLAERYVHVYASRLVRERIPDGEWHAVVKTLTTSVRSDGVGQAVIKAVRQAIEKTKVIFPDTGRERNLANIMEVIE